MITEFVLKCSFVFCSEDNNLLQCRSLSMVYMILILLVHITVWHKPPAINRQLSNALSILGRTNAKSGIYHPFYSTETPWAKSLFEFSSVVFIFSYLIGYYAYKLLTHFTISFISHIIHSLFTPPCSYLPYSPLNNHIASFHPHNNYNYPTILACPTSYQDVTHKDATSLSTGFISTDSTLYFNVATLIYNQSPVDLHS